MAATNKPDYDVIAVGAGFAGLSLIHYMREAGLSIRVFDKASDIGGTWTWNRYPGAASDSECYYYCLTFSKELLQEWKWSVRYPGWEENLKYMHFVADRCDMWPHIQLNTKVERADFQESTGLWLVKTADGKSYTCKYFVSAMGMISEPVIPEFKGMGKFKGPCFHSSRWPTEGLDYAGKRVGIIGSGATTVQMLPVMAKTAANVTVFQRTANFIMPAVQKPMTPEWEKEIKANYDAIVKKCRNHSFGMAFDSPVGRNLADTPPDEVEKILNEHWPRGSFRFVFETFDDLLSNPESNRIVGEFVVRKMLEKVKDPEVREMLTPKGYPFFAKRPPLDHGFHEAFNRDNVKLVDINEREPIVEITETGIMHKGSPSLVLHRLKEIGVDIAIDDFGTGYSSLAYLATLPIRELKIDIQFVRDIAHSVHSHAIVKLIIALARSLNLRVVAEGVETLRQQIELHRLGCEVMQGYQYSHPLPGDEIEGWMRSTELPRMPPWLGKAGQDDVEPARLAAQAANIGQRRPGG